MREAGVAEDRTDEVLSAIATLSERLQAVERSVGTFDRKLDQSVGSIERKLNAIARKLLAPAEVIALGISEPRTGGGGGGWGGEDSGMARAAKPSE